MFHLDEIENLDSKEKLNKITEKYQSFITFELTYQLFTFVYCTLYTVL